MIDLARKIKEEEGGGGDLEWAKEKRRERVENTENWSEENTNTKTVFLSLV